jgi:RNA-directed DNA polymerase
METINKWYQGWASYFKMTQYPAQLKKIEAHIRRRLRARIVKQQKRRRPLYNKLIRQGVNKTLARRTVYSKRNTWALSHTTALEQAYPVDWFVKKMGQKIFSNLKLPGWYEENVWVKLT